MYGHYEVMSTDRESIYYKELKQTMPILEECDPATRPVLHNTLSLLLCAYAKQFCWCHCIAIIMAVVQFAAQLFNCSVVQLLCSIAAQL